MEKDNLQKRGEELFKRIIDSKEYKEDEIKTELAEYTRAIQEDMKEKTLANIGLMIEQLNNDPKLSEEEKYKMVNKLNELKDKYK